MFPLSGAVSIAQMQGPRSTQEDFCMHVPWKSVCNGRGHLLGVFDGHAGPQVARYCASQTPTLFDPNAPDMQSALVSLVGGLVDATKNARMGSTLALACVMESKRRLIAVTLGDSTVAVRARRGERHASIPHAASIHVQDMRKALAAGATYEDGYLYAGPDTGGIQLTRALGDRAFNCILQRTPALFTCALDSSSIVVVASDGAITPGKSTHRADSWEKVLDRATSEKQADAVLATRSTLGLEDNASLVLWSAHRLWFF